MAFMIECDISKDRTWADQYHCGCHGCWFRSRKEPDFCPAGEAAIEARKEALEDAIAVCNTVSLNETDMASICVIRLRKLAEEE